MTRAALIITAMILGLSAPAAAYAQRLPRVPAPSEVVGSVTSAPQQQQEAARRGVQMGREMSLSQILGNVSRRTPGRLLDASRENWGQRPVYRVRWSTNDGQRIDYTVDAQTGAILSQSGG